MIDGVYATIIPKKNDSISKCSIATLCDSH